MSWIWTICGLVILGVVFVDVIWTTLFVAGGGGPISRMIANPIGSQLVKLPNHTPLKMLRVNAGIVAILATLATWVLLIWTGWTLVFCGAEGAVVQTQSGQPASLSDRIYFAGFTLITLGTGDYRPDGALWQSLTVVAAMTGFMFVTLSITYLLPIVSANVEKRSLALYIHHLGRTPHDMVVAGWDDDGFQSFEQHLMAVIPLLLTDAQRIHSYPVLDFFRADSPNVSPALNVATLDEALTLLQYGVASEARPSAAVLLPARRAVETWLTSAFSPAVDGKGPAPALPRLDALRDHGIPTVSEPQYEQEAQALLTRRGHLARLVESHGWKWETLEHREPAQRSILAAN